MSGRRFRSVAVATAVMLGFAAQAANAARNDIAFYAKSGCEGIIHNLFDSEVAVTIDCKHNWTMCNNDTWVSMAVASNVKPGTIIRVWDSPDGSEKDDWAEIRIKTYAANKKDNLDRPVSMCVGNLEMDRSAGDYQLTYHRKNGLAGKISRIQIIPAPASVPIRKPPMLKKLR